MGNRVVITFFRHGMTIDNERRAYLGWANPPLSEKGRKEVQQIYKKRKINRVDLVFSSDLQRCLETARILFPSQTIRENKGVREMNFGEWDRKTYDELKNDWEYKKWLSDPFTNGPVAGESYNTFTNRVNNGFKKIKQEIMEENLSDVAIVTHGGVIRYLLTKFVDSSKDFFDWQVPYSRGYQLKWANDGFRRGEVCISLQEVPTMERKNG